MKIYFISDSLRCLDGRDIWIDQNRFDSFFFQCFQSLRARVVKLTRFPNFQSTRTKDQYLFNFLIIDDDVLFLPLPIKRFFLQA